MHRPRVFVDRISSESSRVSVGSADAHHLSRVLRLRVGDDVGVFDGSGREWLGRVATLSGSAATIELVSEVEAVPEPPVKVTLALGLLKGDQMDHAIRDATALGAAAIVPMTTAHVTVPARAWRAAAAHDRWRRVAIAAAKQCGRAQVPPIGAVSAFYDLLTPKTGAERRPILLCLPPGGHAESREPATKRPSEALVLIGPEGGWSEDEVSRALAAGATPLHLGRRILRAEVVPAIALASLWSRWGW